MSAAKDIRWEQRFSNYKKALKRLEEAVLLSKQRSLSDLEEQGLIQAFEFTFELAWNVMKDYAAHNAGTEKINGIRDVIRVSFNSGLIADGKDWMKMVDSRIETLHSYDEKTAREIATLVIEKYFPMFKEFKNMMEGKIDTSQSSLFS